MESEKKEIVLEPRKKFDYKADQKIFYDMIIIGAGVAGFSTAMYAGRLGLKVLVIGELIGGTITLTHSVENYPGFISITGQKLGKQIENHAKDYDIDVLADKVNKIQIHKKGGKAHFEVFTRKQSFFSKTITIATGTKVRKLGVPGEAKFDGKGVSYCALCDGPLFRGKTLAVVGGSDSAVKEAILLSEYGKKVYIIYRGEKVHPEPPTMNQLNEKIKQGKIEIINNTNITEIKGDKMIGSVVFDKPYNGKNEFPIEGLFVYIGHTPLSDLAEIGVKLNKKSEVIINRNSETNIKGVYAAGDITDSDWKQAVTGVAEGVKAAYYAYQYVSEGTGVLEKGKKSVLKK